MLAARLMIFAIGFATWPALAQPEVVHVPAEDFEANRRAMDELKKQLDAVGGYSFFLEKPELSVHQTRTFVAWDWKDDRIVVHSVPGKRVLAEFRFDALPKIEVIHDTVLGASFYGARLSDQWAMWCQTASPDLRLVCGKWLGEMFSAFRARHIAMVKGRAEFEARFQAALAKYPDSASRPPFPEEARRFRIQAESAVGERRLGDALAAYGQAVNVALWWSEGYYNLALLFAEQKQFESAIRNMKRFLLLEPAHPRAREGQDQIYRWEDLAKTERK